MSESELNLVMPFVTTKDSGGPHDDKSYVCGYEMGILDTVLGMCSHLRHRPEPQLIHSENLPQADLIGMKHGYQLLKGELDGYPEWVTVGFDWADADFDDEERNQNE